MTSSTLPADLEAGIRSAWQGRISGCLMGKAVELLSMREGRAALTAYLRRAEALPIRDYIPLVPGTAVERQFPGCCRGKFDRAEPDDDINYSVLALMMLEGHGLDLGTEDVARAWLRYLPGGMVFTAEREALITLLTRSTYGFGFGAAPGFDLAACSDNAFNDWIGAQIRADVYGWVTPGRPELAAELARRDAGLSHRGEGVFGAMAVAAMAAAVPVSGHLDTDCNAATVGGLWGLTGREIPAQWTDPWNGRVAVSLAGIDELLLSDLVDRTVAVARRL